MGGGWSRLSTREQHVLERTLRRYTVATYAGRFDGYSGEHFVIKRSAPLSPGIRVVYTVFQEQSGKVHDLDYLLRPAGHRWRVINVVADGVSDLSIKRTEFAHVMKTGGFSALIARLKAHIDRMARGG
ncbi:MAG: ABC transporter substrate-binding protein, partial [Acidimicrobiales bacterium]